MSIYVSWKNPIDFDSSVFWYVKEDSCILYVPKETYEVYRESKWGEFFKNIVETDATGIDKLFTLGSIKEVSRYALDGQRLKTPTKGLNIVKYSDGSVRKVVVQ